MFKHGIVVCILAGLSYMAPAAVAQDSATGDSQAPATAQKQEAPGRRFDPQERSQMLAKKLNLSSDQQSKVQDILQSAQSDMQKVRSDSSLARADRRAKMMDIHKSTDDQIRGLLNADQQKKWDTMQARRENRMKRWERRQPAAAPAPEQK